MVQDAAAQERESRRGIYLRAGALISDPMALPGLAAKVERDAVPLEGVPFDTKHTTGQKVNCALCYRKRNHYRGFVVTFAGGRRAIVGRDCGERELFDSGAWQSMSVKAERRKLQVLYEERSAPTIEAIDRLLPLLAKCESGVSPLREFMASVAGELPDLYGALSTATRRGGTLTRYVDRKSVVMGRDGKEREVIDSERRTFATIAASMPFETGGIESVLHRVRLGVQRARKILDQEGVTLVQQGEAFRLLRKLERSLQDAASEAAAAAQYLSADFWQGVAKWGNADHNRYGNYRVSRSGVRHVEGDDLFGEVRFPTPGSYSVEALTEARAAWPRL